MPALALWSLAAAAPASAASTPWQENAGGAVRLVTAGAPDADGRIRGLVDIFLKPGWKTYWREPGSAGVPPSLDIAASRNVEAAELHFPAPERHDDGYGAWAGYGASVALPVTFELSQPGRPALIEAELFLGICQTVCVPVQARLSLDPSAGDEPEDTLSVAAAFAALPAPARPDFGVAAAEIDGGTLRLEARVPEAAKLRDLFLAGGELGYAFGVPVIARKGAIWSIAVPVADRPAISPAARIPYTLVTDGGAVSGEFQAP